MSNDSRLTWGGETRQNHLYKPFLRGALVTVLTIGCTLGAINLVAMGLQADLRAVWGPLIQAHGYAQIFGWVGLFIMGMAYHMVPRFYLRPVPHPQVVLPSFVLAVLGLITRFAAQPFATGALGAWLLVASAALGLAGVSLFTSAMFETMRGGSDKFGTVATALYLRVGFAWLWLASAATLAIALYLAANRLDTIPPNLDAPYLRIALSGAIVTLVLGFTLRMVPHMIGLPLPSSGRISLVLLVYTAAVILQTIGAAGITGEPDRWLNGVGAALELAALAGFVALLGIFRRPPVGSPERSKTNPWPERFVRTAYFWLLFSGALNLGYAIAALVGSSVPHAFMASYHHALTVGFISFMIVGMSMRLVPAFIGAMNRQRALAGLVFALLLTGNTVRVFGQALADLYGGPFYIIMGLSGLVEVTGLAIYSAALWRAMSLPSYGQVQSRLFGVAARANAKD